VSPRRPPQYDLPNPAPEPLRLVQLFLNTRDHEYDNEWLGSPKDVRAWLGERGVAVARVSGDEVARLQRVREALRSVVVTGVVPAVLSAVATRATLHVSLDGELVPSRGGVDGFVARVFATVYDAMRDGTWERLKACPNCRWAFWDKSKNHSATWCSMELCGNRLKTKRYRARRTAAHN
jgi:predicted RNA-binding Zn ribbon-like protein